VYWYKLAAEQGVSEAQFRLGVLTERGEGTPRNDAEAGKWYMRSAEQGYAPAEARLGVLYTQGKGVTQDNLKAYFWLTLATKQDLRIAERLRNQVLAKLAQDDVTKIEMDVSKWRPKVSPVKNATIAH
jgi:hypothetical protein